jgi:hypothetical protein
MGELDDPVVVERGPGSDPSHGTDLLGQRYVYDLVRTDHRRGRTRDGYGWGQPVHATFDGVIVQAVDGVAPRQWLHVVRESWVAVKTKVRFARRGLDPARLVGNHVIMATGGT